MLRNMSAYCGTRNALRCSALPSGECICVMKTWLVAVGTDEKNLRESGQCQKQGDGATGLTCTRSEEPCR